MSTAAPAVQFVGRFDTREDAGPKCAWPGCRVIAQFTGTDRISVTLEELALPWMQGGPSEWDVAIDGVLQPKLVLQLGSHDYVLAEGLSPDDAHTVELYRRSEAQNGVTRFVGYDFHDGTLLSPPPRARTSRRLEVIGDSQVAAFGVEGAAVGPNCPGIHWAAHYENFRESFGALMGERFGAEVFGTAYSGKGMARNITSTDRETMPILFGRTNPLDASSVWDWSWIPDVVVVQIGGNDFAIHLPVDDGPPTFDEFTSAYRGFVTNVRNHYPNAFLLLVLSASTREDIPPGRASRTNVWSALERIVGEHVQQGDDKIANFAPPTASEDERRGCGGHGTPEFHQRIAKQIGDVLSEKVGWN
ncbi:Acetylxylan esterase [Labilithrix luteola]|uniref:Acetylxylan esterase n=1 Tax=Labilithrix luteola TaxID=1391654 RepID=A0A0K1PJC2_9BACT|nr:Acetylxylan esterase [Labilithrix luteola]